MFARFTLSLWLYVKDYCPQPTIAFCSIFQHITWDDRYATPLLYFNRKGKTLIYTGYLYCTCLPCQLPPLNRIVWWKNPQTWVAPLVRVVQQLMYHPWEWYSSWSTIL